MTVRKFTSLPASLGLKGGKTTEKRPFSSAAGAREQRGPQPNVKVIHILTNADSGNNDDGSGAHLTRAPPSCGPWKRPPQPSAAPSPPRLRLPCASELYFLAPPLLSASVHLPSLTLSSLLSSTFFLRLFFSPFFPLSRKASGVI